MRCTPSKPNVRPARIDSSGNPGMGGGVGAADVFGENVLVVVMLVVP